VNEIEKNRGTGSAEPPPPFQPATLYGRGSPKNVLMRLFSELVVVSSWFSVCAGNFWVLVGCFLLLAL
jgi:hypothetical protein